MIISGIAIYLGYKLFVLGVTGQASLSVDTKSISGQLLNAAPGLFFAVGGIIALITSVWKGSNFSFSRANPLESMVLCKPFDLSDLPPMRDLESRELKNLATKLERRSSGSGKVTAKRQPESGRED
jgi:hypothetical protein